MFKRKLTDAQVRAIRLGFDAGIKMQTLADRYNISISMVSLVCSGKRFPHVSPSKSKTIERYQNQGRPKGKKKLDKNTIKRLILFRGRGYSYRELAKMFKISPTTCANYCKGES